MLTDPSFYEGKFKTRLSRGDWCEALTGFRGLENCITFAFEVYEDFYSDKFVKADVQFSSAEQTKVCYGAEGRFINNAPARDTKRSVGHWLFLVIPETSGLGINDLRDKEIKILKVELTDKSTPFNSMRFHLGNYGVTMAGNTVPDVGVGQFELRRHCIQ